MVKVPNKAPASDFIGRFREIISDPLNVLIDRHALAGVVENEMVYLHNGHTVPLTGAGSYYGAFSDILCLNRGVHEPLEEFVFQEMLKHLPTQPVMLELGAYWAHYSMWLMQCRPTARCFMVEPDPGNLQAGRSNFERHRYDGVFIQAKVGVDGFTVDDFLESQGLDVLTVLHADVQGFEDQMLEGAKGALRRNAVEYIFVSTHSQALHQATERQLTNFGYRVEVSSDFDHHTMSFDGLVFATAPHVPPILAGFTPMGRSHLAGAPSLAIAGYLDEIVRRPGLKGEASQGLAAPF